MMCFVLNQSVTALPVTKRNRFRGYLKRIGIADSPDNNMKQCMDIQVKEIGSHSSMGICTINRTAAGQLS